MPDQPHLTTDLDLSATELTALRTLGEEFRDQNVRAAQLARDLAELNERREALLAEIVGTQERYNRCLGEVQERLGPGNLDPQTLRWVPTSTPQP